MIFWKVFENEGEHPYLTSGQLNCKNSLILGQNMQNLEISKNCHFSQVRGHRNLHFFLFWKVFETDGKLLYLTSGQLNCKNSLILGQNMQSLEISKKCHFSQVRGHRNLHFFLFWKVFETDGKLLYLRSGQLKCKTSLICGENMQN